MNATTSAREVTLSNAEIALMHAWHETVRTGQTSVKGLWLNICPGNVEKHQEIVNGLVAKGMMKQSEHYKTNYELVMGAYRRASSTHKYIWEADYYTARSEFLVNNPDNQDDWWDFTIVVTL